MILAVSVILINVLSCVMPRILSIILDIVNIGLHIALVVLCFILLAPPEEVTLVIMASVFSRSLAYMIFARTSPVGRRER